jgi:hypothetical protein
VAGWLQARIIERSRSPYNSQIFCVPKKDGQGLRCVLDYRRVDHSSFSDCYALRTIDECLKTVGRAGCKVYSALDCSSAFWQLQLRPSDCPFTAFTIPGKGQYHWRTCPQGLMGAPASFSKLMDVPLADAENVLTYIDDVLVHSQTHEQHLKHLAAAIDKIGTANLRLNPKKCVFRSDSVEYLGHTLSGDGVRPRQDKAKAMQSAQPLRSVKELRSFCGLANYFRSYIVQFAILTAPLFRLTRQDSDWKGGDMPPEAASAFLRLRDEISSRPVMAYPNATGQYHLFVDAALGAENNSGGLEAVLMQDQEAGLRKPVVYASRRLDKHERNYPVFLAEMQAEVFGMEQFHHFLITGRFALYTDHRPLCKLSLVHVKTFNRLQLKMTELHPDIKYIEGKNNIIANFLSRYHGMIIHVTDVKYDEGRVNAVVASLSHKDLGAPVQMFDASPFRVRVL